MGSLVCRKGRPSWETTSAMTTGLPMSAAKLQTSCSALSGKSSSLPKKSNSIETSGRCGNSVRGCLRGAGRRRGPPGFDTYGALLGVALSAKDPVCEKAAGVEPAGRGWEG
uniref:Uncharacterized protein n=1 Tax=Paenarthrobacter aurescens TaxID=43663 RepID=Q6SK70_PAEAU|nr:hypothetical protein [Paenarthrobacter aurescens]